MKWMILYLVAMIGLGSCAPHKPKQKVKTVTLHNPILPGYFADPSLVQYGGKFYIYVTADPWGTDFLSCWESDDFRNWTFRTLNWPTKEACTSLQSNENNVWAPSVVQRGDTFYMYVSVGSEVWCGMAKHPLGPWKNALGKKPLIPADTTRYYHVIDAEAFIDDNGKAYLYWGSGWNWVNGHCYVAELNADMISFRTKPVEVTPPHYFEAPFMWKHKGKYYLTYSDGKTIDDTYQVRYAVGDSPIGPFQEAANSPILSTCDSLQVFGPGHHALFSFQGKDYMLYHRHRLPFVSGTAYRQTCLAQVSYNDVKHEIRQIIPSHTQTFPDITKVSRQYVQAKAAESSTFAQAGKGLNSPYIASRVLDGDYSTRWEAAEGDMHPTLTLSFGDEVTADVVEVRFEYPWKKYYVKVETSSDGEQWNETIDYSCEGISGSPVVLPLAGSCKYVRLSFSVPHGGAIPSVWEVLFY